MVQLITATIPLRQSGTLDDMARMSASWWTQQLIIDGVRYGEYEVRNEADVNRFEDDLTLVFRDQFSALRAEAVWTLTSDHVFLENQLRSARLPKGIQWPSNILMSMQVSSEGVGIVVARNSSSVDETVYYHVLEA